MAWPTYLSLYVVAGAIACLAGYHRLPLAGYRALLALTVAGSAVHFMLMLGPAGWVIAPLALAGVITLMAWSDSPEGESPDVAALTRAAVRLWRGD